MLMRVVMDFSVFDMELLVVFLFRLFCFFAFLLSVDLLNCYSLISQASTSV